MRLGIVLLLCSTVLSVVYAGSDTTCAIKAVPANDAKSIAANPTDGWAVVKEEFGPAGRMGIITSCLDGDGNTLDDNQVIALQYVIGGAADYIIANNLRVGFGDVMVRSCLGFVQFLILRCVNYVVIGLAVVLLPAERDKARCEPEHRLLRGGTGPPRQHWSMHIQC